MIEVRKYEYGFGLRGAAATLRRLGSGNPPLQRFRIGIEFVMSGHRDMEGMIATHAKLARTLAKQLGLPHGVLEALSSAYEQRPSRLSAPSRCRIASAWMARATHAAPRARRSPSPLGSWVLQMLIRPCANRVLIARLGRLTRRRRLCAPRFALGVWTVTRWKRSSVQPVTVRGDGGRGRPGSRPVRSTPKTAGNHIEHVYGKIDATNRATASLFAVQHGLLPEEVVTGAARRKSAEKEQR